MAKEKLTPAGLPESASTDGNNGRKAFVPVTPLQQFELYRKLLRGDQAFQWVFFNLELEKCNTNIIG
ncbi:hypothetical protein GFS24_01835 [Chitinophaga sp. SYP-B3965]|uniref:hypothetical protein n=1 Tax=Chitinophaga sp. SYP-B3965 TaxID=2663120 RepID=UPI001299E04C|nr:hypothetical protein [Chitinophaga sp. SYP-B3965]MRG43832.1 hypothetical protein [Chitinophaga sp. SYP-B3965]